MKPRARVGSAVRLLAVTAGALALAAAALASARAEAVEAPAPPAAPAPGDRVRVTLAGGGTLTGTLVREDADELLLEIRPGMRTRLLRAEVTGLERLPPASPRPPAPPPPPPPPPPASVRPPAPPAPPASPADPRAVLAEHSAALRALDRAKDAIQAWTKDPGPKERLRAARAMREAARKALAGAPALPLPRREREAYGRWLSALERGFGETEALLAREAVGEKVPPEAIEEAVLRAAAGLGEADAAAAEADVGGTLRNHLLDLGLPLAALDRPIAPLLGWTAGLAHAAALDRLEAAYGAVEDAADRADPVGPAHVRACAEDLAAAGAEALRTAEGVGLAPAELALHREYLSKTSEALGGLLEFVRQAAEKGARPDERGLETTRARLDERLDAFEALRGDELDALDGRLEELGVGAAGSGTLFGLPGDNAWGFDEEEAPPEGEEELPPEEEEFLEELIPA